MGGIFESFASGGFLALLFTIGTVIIVVSINSTEIDKRTSKILEEAKEIYSLDYSKLYNIKQIELNNQHEYFVILKNDDNDWRFKLEKNSIPHTQSKLELLDKKYEGKNAKIGDSEIV